jgi:hypothetical protein
LDLFPFAGSPGVFDLENDRQLPVEEIHDDPVVAMTRENYLELAYLKKNPVLSAEEEAGLPEQFQLRDPDEDVLDLPIGLDGNKKLGISIDCPQTSKTGRHI